MFLIFSIFDMFEQKICFPQNLYSWLDVLSSNSNDNDGPLDQVAHVYFKPKDSAGGVETLKKITTRQTYEPF